MSTGERQQLEVALRNWREVVLRWLRDEIAEAEGDRQRGESGLAIAWRNQGLVAADVIATLWDQLESNSTRVFRLARIADRIAEMDLPELIVLFQRTQKISGYPWDGERWELPSF